MTENNKLRVMDYSEVVATKEHDVYLWLEKKNDEDIFHLQVYGYTGNGECIYFDIPDDVAEFFLGEYGNTWRCWTERPTHKQRSEVKWDD